MKKMKRMRPRMRRKTVKAVKRRRNRTARGLG